ncbi:MAG TPA: cytochrome c oxidase assembly protein [Usitatibacter sp.]|nr:cytochrome c oxidase assembly protein [Usitatibacter sp.]
MEHLRQALLFLVPWEFSPLALVLCAGGAGAYALGLRRSPRGERPSVGRRIAFFTGCALVWFVMQTRFDYFAQHMFFMHRIAHLVLHHLGAFLIALSLPLATIGRGLPAPFARNVARFWERPGMQLAVRAIQNVWVGPVVFVGLIFFWLTPPIHFVAMLSPEWYWVMNWSMFLDGLLFWALVLDPRGPAEGGWAGFGPRIWMLVLAMPPQIVLGAYIALSGRELFDVYGLCGRAWDMSAATDQTIGGLVTWIPAAMMHVVGALIVFSRWMHADRGRPAPARVLASGIGD